MYGDVRAVAPCQVEGVGVVLDVVLLVQGLSEPGDEVAAEGDTARVVGRERDRSLVGPRHPELVAVREEGDVEDLVCRDRGERAGLAGTRVRHRVREQLDVVGMLGDRDRSSTARGRERDRAWDERCDHRRSYGNT